MVKLSNAQNISQNLVLLNTCVHDVWTFYFMSTELTNQNFFYIKYGSFGCSFCDKNCIPRSVEERVNFELKGYQNFISQKRVFILGLAISTCRKKVEVA